MSADNFLAVLKEGDKFVGYHCSASMYYPQQECYRCIGSQNFEANSVEEAVRACENFDADGFGYLEYGYNFVGLDAPVQERDYSFCKNCPQNPDNPEEGSEEAIEMGCTCTRTPCDNYKGEVIYGYSMGKNCPVHSSLDWKGWGENISHTY